VNLSPQQFLLPEAILRNVLLRQQCRFFRDKASSPGLLVGRGNERWNAQGGKSKLKIYRDALVSTNTCDKCIRVCCDKSLERFTDGFYIRLIWKSRGKFKSPALKSLPLAKVSHPSAKWVRYANFVGSQWHQPLSCHTLVLLNVFVLAAPFFRISFLIHRYFLLFVPSVETIVGLTCWGPPLPSLMERLQQNAFNQKMELLPALHLHLNDEIDWKHEESLTVLKEKEGTKPRP